jgi:uncharacterized protein DUF4440
MKRCPTCKRVFEDDSLAYCLDDGSPLVSEKRTDSDPTLVSPAPPPAGQMPPTQSARYESAVSSLGAAPKRRVWPWVVGGLLVLFFFVIAIVAVIAIQQIVKKSQNSNRVVIDVPTPEPAETSSPNSEESPSPSEAPRDENVVQTQLTDLEKRWTQANIDGDKAALEQILADEYSGGDPPHNKRQYIDELKPDTAVKSWELEDLSVDLDGDRATMTGYLRQVTTAGSEVYSFTDEFVWRDGRWQATGSRTVRVK